MRYYSTNHKSQLVDFRQAAVKGQPEDKGLYFPESIPVLSKNFIDEIEHKSKEEIALEVISPYVGDAIETNELRKIVEETVNFDFPLVQLSDDVFALELFHGPTLAFKDVGARFMSRCLEYFVRNNDRKVIVLTATSGDTGGAVGNGFYKAAGIDVVILYPSKKVSRIQELQLTTLGHNIHALEINGSFDDCQRLVKQAFADEQLNAPLMLTSANSINIARWLPQQFYYFFAYQQWPDKHLPPVISVPSGNFGNLCAGLLAYRSGLPAAHFIAACNSNDVVPEYFKTGQYKAKPSVQTLSNAMDVGDPSNFVRMMELFHSDHDVVSKLISPYSISDEETRNALKEQKYPLDPHGAVAYTSLKKYLQNNRGSKGIFLETAHPVKFDDAIELPDAIKELTYRKKEATQMDADYATLKDYLFSQFPK
jgi:threonine synthase